MRELTAKEKLSALTKKAAAAAAVATMQSASDGFTFGNAIKALFGSPKLGIVGGLALGAYALRHSYDNIKNDQKRRAIFESLCWDPAFKDLDKSKLLEWYISIYHYSPDTSLDKTATKELLRQFMTFGKVDIQTLKTLAETQKAVSEARDKDRFQMKFFG